MAAQQPSILPAHLMEAQLSTIDLLTAMYPDELDIPASETQCLEKLRAWCENPTSEISGVPAKLLLALQLPVVENEKSIHVNMSIPLHCTDPTTEMDQPPPVGYSLRQPDWMSKAEVAELSSGMPDGDVLGAFEYIQDKALQFLESQKQHADLETAMRDASGPAQIVRVWFYFPSLSTRAKRDDMVSNAPGYLLTGFVLAGKPGVLCLEGASADIDAYMSFIKTHSWGDIPSHQKKVSERFRETDVQRVFEGMEEITDSLGERSGHRANRGDMQALEAWLQARGLGDAFERVIF